MKFERRRPAVDGGVFSWAERNDLLSWTAERSTTLGALFNSCCSIACGNTEPDELILTIVPEIHDVFRLCRPIGIGLLEIAIRLD